MDINLYNVIVAFYLALGYIDEHKHVPGNHCILSGSRVY